jgi:flagellin-like hook-associated protein FlgL
MGRIGATLSGIERTLLNRLADANAGATINRLRLATGKRVNSPRDDVSAFTTLSRFQTRLSTVTATMKGVTAAGSLVSQTQTTLASIRTQLDTIRTTLLTDESQSLSAADRTAAQAAIDTAVNQINSLAATEIDGRRMLDGSAAFTLSGRNNSQISDLVVRSVGGAGPTVPGARAELTYTGASRYAAAAATIEISGNIGSTTIAVTTNDTLEDVAQTINARTDTTGVTASVDDNTLTLQSSEIGDNQTVAVVVSAGTFNVSGGNGDGTANGVTPVYGSSPALSGSVQQAATRAQLTYTGTTAQISAGDGGDITITGTLGSATVTVADGELLTDVVTKINNQSHKTGITAAAEVASDTMTLTSVDYGTDATLEVSATSSFSTTGGNGDDTANGTDMTVTVNGITYAPSQAAKLRHRESTGLFTANSTIRVTGHAGFADFTINIGDSLALIASNINAQKANTGVAASVDGNDLLLTSTISGDDGRVNVEVTSGTFDTVTDFTAAAPAELVYAGTSGQLTANADFRLTGTGFFDFSFAAGEFLSDIATTINGETGTTGVQATAVGDQLYLRSVATGSGASISVTNVVGDFDVTGGNGDGTADGVNASAADTGSEEVTPNATLDGNRLSVNRNGLHFEIEFADGFTGQFDTVSILGDALSFALATDVGRKDTLAIPSVFAENLGGLSGKLNELLTGGTVAGLNNNTAAAIRIVDEALADLTRIEGSVDGFYNAAISSSSNLLDEIQKQLAGDATAGTAGFIAETDGYDEDLETLLLAKNQQLAANAIAGLTILDQQRQSIITMIQRIAGLA